MLGVSAALFELLGLNRIGCSGQYYLATRCLDLAHVKSQLYPLHAVSIAIQLHEFQIYLSEVARNILGLVNTLYSINLNQNRASASLPAGSFSGQSASVTARQIA